MGENNLLISIISTSYSLNRDQDEGESKMKELSQKLREILDEK